MQIWSLIGVIGLGLVLLLSARFILQSTFSRIELESGRTVIRGKRIQGAR